MGLPVLVLCGLSASLAGGGPDPAEPPSAIVLVVKPFRRKELERVLPREQVAKAARTLCEGEACARVDGGPPLSPVQLVEVMRERYKREKENGRGGEVHMVVRFQADEDITLGDLFTFMGMVKKAGFTRMTLRALPKEKRP